MKTEKRGSDRRSFSLNDRFHYWFDNRMAQGSLGFIRLLIIVSVLLAVILAGLIILLGFNEEGETASVFWDSIATVINAWMPYYEEGSPGYLALMSITAIAGVLFTSVLIGIITSAIEEKIDSLKKGNSLVLERNHIVLLGFYPGEYTLLNQLILAASGKPDCVVVVGEMERDEMEHEISENLDIPKNFRIVCRTADITDPTSLERCSVETCRTVIISPTNDMKTTKAILAVSSLLEEKGVPEISVNAIITKNEYRFPPSIAEANNITTFQTNSILAKMIAHACTQAGLSETFKEIFNFEGSEFYLIELPDTEGISFEEIMISMDNAVPAGVYRDGRIIMNPPASFVLKGDDRILVFAEDGDSAIFRRAEVPDVSTACAIEADTPEDLSDTVIIGHNETLPTILHELSDCVSQVYLAGQNTTEAERQALERSAAARGLQLKTIPGNLRSESVLLDVAKKAQHIVILNNHDKDPEEADMEAIFLLLNLRDIRKRYGLSFNIAMEMQQEHNQKLVGRGDYTDFLVSSSMSSLILAQLAESPELIGVFREILSNEGNELYLKSVKAMGLTGTHRVRDLRLIMLRNGYVMMGCLNARKESLFNLSLNEEISLNDDDLLIVLGEK